MSTSLTGGPPPGQSYVQCQPPSSISHQGGKTCSRSLTLQQTQAWKKHQAHWRISSLYIAMLLCCIAASVLLPCSAVPLHHLVGAQFGPDGPRGSLEGMVEAMHKAALEFPIEKEAECAARDKTVRLLLLSIANARIMDESAALLVDSLHAIKLQGGRRLSSALLMVTTDGTAMARCKAQLRGQHCLIDGHSRWEPTAAGPHAEDRSLHAMHSGLAFIQVRHMLNIVSAGFSVLYLDAGTVVLKNPIPQVLASGADFAVARKGCLSTFSKPETSTDEEVEHGASVVFIRTSVQSARCILDWSGALWQTRKLVNGHVVSLARDTFVTSVLPCAQTFGKSVTLLDPDSFAVLCPDNCTCGKPQAGGCSAADAKSATLVSSSCIWEPKRAAAALKELWDATGGASEPDGVCPAIVNAVSSRSASRLPAPSQAPALAFIHPTAAPVIESSTRTMAAVVENAASAETIANNPLLEDWDFPPYDRVEAVHVVPGIKTLLAELHKEVDALEANVVPTWAGLVEPLERISDRHQRTWGIVGHLKAVQDSDELRQAVEEVEPDNVKLSLRMSQSKPLYEGFKALKADKAQWESMSAAQKRLVENELRDFVLGGVSLDSEEKKERFNAIQQDLTQMATKFSNNVLDSTKAFKKLLTTKEEVDGLPASALGMAAQQAQKEPGHENATPEEGPWLFTLDYPSYQPAMTHAKNRALREEMYTAFVTRASTGEKDNAPIIDKVLKLRQEMAVLLGFKHFANLSMASKMATLDSAEALLEELRSKSYDAAKKDLEDVKEFAKQQGVTDELKWWDMTFWAERLREAKYSINEEELRPYFALPNVLEGLFTLANRLFDVEIVAADGKAPVWHKDVRFFELRKDGKTKAYFYFDPYSRPAEKRGGAWFDEVLGQSKLMAPAGLDVRLPVAHMVCNQGEPVGDKPSLMTFMETETLFHEFGHAMQHMMTTVDEGMVAGIRGVEWDAVELPSQFMENWCYDHKTLYSFAKHYETGEALPEDMFKKLKAAKTFRSGSMMLRQIHFSSIDLDLHSRFTPGGDESVFDRDRALGAKTMVTPPFPGDRFLCSFSHIFAGGYSAGYFSYKWAEVLSADAFAAFEEVGLENEEAVKATGARFRDTVLSLGGSVAPAEVFKQFRGREPSTEPLLKHNDLLVSV